MSANSTATSLVRWLISCSLVLDPRAVIAARTCLNFPSAIGPGIGRNAPLTLQIDCKHDLCYAMSGSQSADQPLISARPRIDDKPATVDARFSAEMRDIAGLSVRSRALSR